MMPSNLHSNEDSEKIAKWLSEKNKIHNKKHSGFIDRNVFCYEFLDLQSSISSIGNQVAIPP
ncbi:hypothetical protein FB550_10324 [Neobacillus bataviensis]|uniref:Uncharacterized protein n=1 Tax=Neobacillus bataviensis TaxID=220685 RepID=A0A561DNC2_9BACI|nr:hypothetical protein FB550_10324 [Neobacillus bataviensis]